MTLKQQVDSFVRVDPVKAVTLVQGTVIFQGIGALLAAGVPETEILDLVATSIAVTKHLQAQVKQ